MSKSILLIESPKFLSFDKEIIIPSIEKFRVGDFFNESNLDFPFDFKRKFDAFIKKHLIDLEVGLENEFVLNKFILIKEASDSDIRSDFKEPKTIPIETLLPIIKYFFEQKGYLGYFNLFHADINNCLGGSYGPLAFKIYKEGDYNSFGLLALDYDIDFPYDEKSIYWG